VNIQISQGFEVLPYKSGKAYPIPCDEWELLKKRIKVISTQPVFWASAASVLAGGGLGTLVAILTGTYADPIKLTIAWCITAGAIVCSFFCGLCGWHDCKAQQVLSSDIVAQMEIIEARYAPALAAPKTTPSP